MTTIYPALSRAIEGFVLWKSASGRSESTISGYRTYLELFSQRTGDPDINKVTSKMIEGFFIYLQTEYKATRGGKPTGKLLSSSTLANIWIAENVFWKWAVSEYKIKNPFNIIRIKPHNQPVNPFSREEVEQMLKMCDVTEEKKPDNRSAYVAKRPTAKRDRAIILTLLDSGIRVSELCGITIADFDANRKQLKVTGKGRKTRYVYVGKKTKQAIQAYLSERSLFGTPANTEHLFVDKCGDHSFTRTGVLHLLNRIGERANVKNVHPHRFRHTFATEFIRNGGNIFTLQQLLGHSSLDMVRHYVQLAQVDIERQHHMASPADNWHTSS